MRANMNVRATIHNYQLKIHINGLLHLCCPATNISIQSWIDGQRGICGIEFYTDGNVVECEYTERKLWEKILKELDKVL